MTTEAKTKIGAQDQDQGPGLPELRAERADRSDDARPLAVRFWGVHGTLPVPGEHTLRYGGNTSCVTVTLSGQRLFIFDAGSGIKVLSDQLMAAGGQVAATIFISHPHWDHINALPFFAPLYLPGNEFRICGPAQGERGIKNLLSAQMDKVFFPITIEEFRAELSFCDLSEGCYDIDGARVSALQLTHQGYCLGYRIDYCGRSVCYLTDNELHPESSPNYDARTRERLIDFARDTDVLITDSTYFDQEYAQKQGWGHSCLSEVADFAHRAGAKTLYLFHHDPAHGDDDIDRKLEFVQQRLADLRSATTCCAPKEQDLIEL